jgi:hypothetical protein
MGVYRIVHEDGSVEYTDVPTSTPDLRPAPGQQDRPAKQTTEEQHRKAYERAKTLMKEAQKRIPKVQDYLEYIAYLRTNSPARFDYVMRELKKGDFDTWLKLQKYPRFRPLGDTVLGVKAGERMIGLGLGSATGSFMGSFEKFAETTLKSMMARDGWNPDVLGAKSTTLPTPPAPVYSGSKLGNWLKQEEATLVRAAKAAASELEGSSAALRAAKGTAISRAGGPVLDTLTGFLDPNIAQATGVTQLSERARKLYERGVLDVEQWDEVTTLLGQSKYDEARKFMDDATHKYIFQK